MSENTKFSFKAETNKVLKIITHSLYQQSEVFLRELISNASDALNKARLKKLTSDTILNPDLELEIKKISIDKTNKTLTISDSGIGMSKKELMENLGTIAKSGTENFLKALEEGENDSSELIGMFGVGFYSAFLVSDKVEVVTKGISTKSTGWKWSSDGEDSFSIETIDKNERGTEIILYIKDDESEYLEEFRIKQLVKQYSNYVAFPIKLIKEDEEEDDEILNEQKAIWRQSPDEVTEEEYDAFYRYLGQSGTPLAKIHVRVESPIQFSAILYIPSFKPQNFGMTNDKWGLTLYNRKVLINEYNKDLLPEWSRFIVGVVDGEDFQLNVSREVLQSTRATRTIEKYLTKQIIKKLEDIANETEKLIDDDEKPESFIDYMLLWREFGAFIKEGVASEAKHKERLIELLRFNSTDENGKDGSVSLEDYVKRMGVDQEKIYYLTGLEYDLLKNSPHLGYYKKNKLEVLLLGEPIDSFLMMHLTDYHEKEFFLIDQDEEESGEENEDGDAASNSDNEEEQETKLKEGPFAPLLNKMVDVLGGRVRDVKMSDRLVGSMARLVTPSGGINSNLQRAMKIMDAQGGNAGLGLPMMGKVLQLNPENKIIIALNNIIEKDTKDERIEPLILQIHDNARILEGDVPDFSDMLNRVETIMNYSLNQK
ncbi:MAG: molecular chaperone HtpG [Candidatus Kariarchaeum pelagius]